MPPANGDVFIAGENLWTASAADQERLKRRFGVSFRSGGLWSSIPSFSMRTPER
jgi:ABC-type transporter Mla maintaining outer membrane lipid asymmetry ATPase subunit MlaF